MKILIFSLLLSLFSILYADENSISIARDIEKSKSIDELIEKMNKAQERYRYMYMNAIKSKIISLKEESREKAMDDVIEKMHESERGMEHQQNKNGFGSTKDGTMGIGNAKDEGGFGGNGDMGGDLGGGMGGVGGGMGGMGNSGGGMGSGSGGMGGHH